MSASELAPAFFIAAVVILLVCRIVSFILTRLGQPAVVGEMIAGVVLGPSVFGLLAPGLSKEVFPTELRPILYVVGQIGLVALMFHAGYEFRRHAGRGLARSALIISVAGMVVPMLGGTVLALGARDRVDIFVPGVAIGVTVAFVAVALAITAFPMLARIITERGISGTRFGSLSLAAGATDDVVAWILLAGVLSVASGHVKPILLAVGGSVLFVILLVLVVRRFLAWYLTRPGAGTETRLLVVSTVLFGAAWFTDVAGLYAVFGAFCLGLVMPPGEASDEIVHGMHSVTRVLFLPMFFTYSGLQTRFDLFTKPSVIIFAAASVAVAVLGKYGGCWAAARLCGEDNLTALRVGALMNARGLMQLIALNIGLAAGIVTNQLFTALVLVALVTTTMASPILSWLDRREPKSPGQIEEPALSAPRT
ncbi:cation:proton antiporter [Nocardia pseudobrasiliensis]|uniref:Transporter (CPA2 family) n=1 Tax=Nocardia pseudobrasiliensis TaxID=45979 RepID=A0A370HPG6_9NOCA|nr:cation:proton antiporter [Nocardia pseudobrasiliensis]RDI60347.1 transporter (CPA2 family) [Nocardia pseudobrasiliensis]